MKKIACITALLLALGAASASASRLNLAWTNCLGDGGTTNQNFACNANTGASTMIASFTPNMTSSTVNGNEVVIDVQTASSALPAWWEFKNPGTCRPSALSLGAFAPVSSLICLEEFAGAAFAGIGAYKIGFGGPNRARLVIAEAVPAEALAYVDDSAEWFSVSVTIKRTSSTGAGACAGCSTPACIVLNSIKLTAGGGAKDEFIGTSPGTNYVTWQGGVLGGGGCPAATPARNTTWGAVKSLYR
jgi:hypothetical protein